ncbi:MAG: SpoIIE family protein phosphatase [Bacteroidetes bacterium]|nr:SpoIIE family protein phosphatase [Bacteroidota bacterium]
MTIYFPYIRLLNNPILSFICLIFLLSLGIAVKAQTKTIAKEPIYNFSNFNTEQGLALSSISCGYIDSNGNIWFGTYGGGVSKYDGKSFSTFDNTHGLSHNTVWSIFEDKFGNIWMGTDGGGISLYDGYSFTSITSKQGLPHNTIWYISSDKNNNIWLATYGGASKFEISEENISQLKNKSYHKSLFTNYTTDEGLAYNDVRNIIEDSYGNLWMGTFNGLSLFDGVNFTNFTTDNGLANNAVLNICEDNLGNIWIGTDKGVNRIKYNPNLKKENLVFETFTTTNGLAHNSVREIVQDSRGLIWFGTAGGGVSFFENGIFTTITTEQGLAHNNIRSISEDKNGNIWFGTVGGGVSRYNGRAFTTYTKQQGLIHDRVFSIIEDSKGNLWFGTVGGGVSKFDGKHFTSFTTEHGLPNNSVYGILEDSKGNMWFGTFGGGVSKFNGKSFKNYTVDNGLVHNRIWRILEDKSGNIWLGSFGGGVSKFYGVSFENFTTENGLSHNTVECIFEDNSGNIWLGTVGGGANMYDGKSFLVYTTENGLPHNRVRCIAQDASGYIWFGTDAGLARFDGNSFITFNTNNGLPDNVIYDIIEDEKSIIWIGTNMGISGLFFTDKEGKTVSAGSIKSNNDSFKEKYTALLEIFNNKTGFAVKDINTNVMCYSKKGLPKSVKNTKGLIWAGCGDDKVICFNPEYVNKSFEKPNLFIQDIRINDEKICWHTLHSFKNPNYDSIIVAQNQIKKFGHNLSYNELEEFFKKFADVKFDGITPFFQLPQKLILTYNQNNITFHFNAVETGRNFLINYQYMLIGQDKDWRPVTRNSFATYGNLYEGDYIFIVRAQSPEGVWSDEVSLSFKVLPPWWRNWWMYIMYVFILVFSGWMIVLWRIRNLQKDKKFLEQVVKERTIELLHQKDEAEKQKALVEQKNEQIALQHNQLAENHKAVSDSINYAQRLQLAILPSARALQDELKNIFILYKPKEVVSGDFYWMEKGMNQEDGSNVVYFAVADCTGHGVPGALVSVVCCNALNRVVKEFQITNTGEILDKVNKLVIETFDKSGMDIHEGMDIALCSINWDKKTIEYSGARIPLNIISSNKDLSKIDHIIVEATPKSIGKWKKEAKPFDTKILQLQKGDYLFMSTDGLHDQFGGPMGEKFSAKQLQQLIINNLDKPLEKQKEIIEKAIEDWKKGWDQVDDICVMGIKI